MCMVFGEISSKAQINYEQIARQVIKQVGYDDVKKGMDYKYSIFTQKLHCHCKHRLVIPRYLLVSQTRQLLTRN